MSDDKRIIRSKNMTAFYKGITEGEDKGAWTQWRVPSQSDESKDYDVIIALYPDYPGGFFGLAKQKSKIGAKIQHLANSDVKVYCSCPDFYWGGAKYNVGAKGKVGNKYDSLVPGQSGNYKWDTSPVTHAPDVRDPGRRHILCKHILSVKNVFAANTASIFSQAKNYVPPTPQMASDDTKKPMVTPNMLVTADEEVASEVTTNVNKLVDDMATNMSAPTVVEPTEQNQQDSGDIFDIEPDVDEEEPKETADDLQTNMANNIEPDIGDEYETPEIQKTETPNENSDNDEADLKDKMSDNMING